jgi:hypothetical protein
MVGACVDPVIAIVEDVGGDVVVVKLIQGLGDRREWFR